MRNTVVTCLVLLLAGCASAPDGIAPRQTDARQFEPYSCVELADKAASTTTELQRYVDSQNRARVGDAFTWPVSTARLFGKNSRNVEAISRLRGELDAIERVRTQKRCEVQPSDGTPE